MITRSSLRLHLLPPCTCVSSELYTMLVGLRSDLKQGCVTDSQTLDDVTVFEPGQGNHKFIPYEIPTGKKGESC